ncbi:glycoside hydrolase family 38 C-terminal domain-containing protein [Demequina sp. NBRC 110052]|uniref:alpha-mannosidase n=1 Tax=Demequina sp. NBRC 110052 TaxID=1570341 RepID=UPI0009FD5293|nr:glycoside hydrolase family 38 C-terminal domain-containing protein [Demequina sp. NBRC 110052]
MHDNRVLVEERIARFLNERLEPAIYRDRAPLTISAWTVADEPVPFAEAVEAEYAPVALGFPWGEPWSTTWFRVTGDVPSHWLAGGAAVDGTAVEAVIDLGFDATQTGFQAEGLAHLPDGTILKSIQPYNRTVRIDSSAVDLFIEAAGNPQIGGVDMHFNPTPMGDKSTAPKEPLYRLKAADVALLDVEVWELVQDSAVLHGLMRELPLDSTRRAVILRALEAMCDAVDPDDVAGTAAQGRAALAPALAARANASAHRAFAVGHAHIDSAWLWPVRETVRKCARTFSNQIALMDENPDYRFACSSAQQYAWVEERYPALFERIKEKVANGQFVPVGSMWVESDTNMPGGEALARQFVAGKNYFMSRFGVETTDVWLPDSFGYTGALPQIARAAGCDDFLSQKLSWNETNKMPHHTFRWQGIDGSSVFTHFPPVDMYNSELSAKEVLHAETNFAEKGAASSSIIPFGWGDGGGGATREMIAAARRMSDLEGLPRVQLASPDEYFADAREEYSQLPTWVGEMYLEFHRGTYTSQARMKQGNRRSEHLLREAELWAAAAAVRADVAYPYEELEDIWRRVLLYQFHDILPGSAIGWVHREAEFDYVRIAEQLEAIIERSLQALIGEGSTEIMLNAAPHARRGVPALGGSAVVSASEGPSVEETAAGWVVDTGAVRATITRHGTVISLVDLASGRETVPAGSEANVLQLHRDTPRQWDAWDIDAQYLRHRIDLLDADSVTMSQDGAFVAFEIVRTFGSSRVIQTLRMKAGSPELEIVTEVDWHEKQKLLKLAFPVDVMVERSAAEMQFGHVYRPTHGNTSWDDAKFEICAHRWVHVGDAGFGVAIANDATYGHDIVNAGDDDQPHTLVRLSLLRSAVFPDPVADEGRHVLTSVVRPGAGIADAVALGYRTNLPERVVTGGREVAPLIDVDGDGIVVESVKLAEDQSGDVVVRLYESEGRRSTATVSPGFAASHVSATDLLERAVEQPGVTCEGSVASLDLRPFKIVTLRFKVAR